MNYTDLDRFLDMLIAFGIEFTRRSLESVVDSHYISLSVGAVVTSHLIPVGPEIAGIPGLRMDFRFSDEGKYLGCGIWDD